MQIDSFLNEFKNYCDDRYGTKTGTSVSYVNSIKYLLEYLGFAIFDETVITSIKSIEPDLKDTNNNFYKELLQHFLNRGQSSYVKKGFIKAAIHVLYDFSEIIFSINPTHTTDNVLIPAILDKDIKSTFDINKLEGYLPLSQINEHNYTLRKTNGTTKDAIHKIKNGRTAEKYFLSFLKDYLGLIENNDFFDVANNKQYGYDVRLFDLGLEIKNVKNGSFYITDNEIARIQNTETHLIFVDIDNGIWLLKNNSTWLNQRICDIKKIREYSFLHYPNLDLSDIRINIDENIYPDIIDITKLSKSELLKLLNS